MASGWIKLDRSILEDWIWEDAATFRVWIYLLLKVNHEDRKTVIGGKLTTIKRGEHFTSTRIISEQTGIPEKRVRAILGVLEGANIIARKGQTNGTTISLIEYGSTALPGQTIGYTNGYTTGQTNGYTTGYTTTDKQESTEERNKNKEKEKYSTSTNTRSEYGEYKNVFLTGEEYGMLVGEFGLEAVKEKIEKCSQWKKNNGYKIKSDYLLLRKWLTEGKSNYAEPPKRPLPEPAKEEPAAEEDTVANMSDDEWVRWMNENYKG